MSSAARADGQQTVALARKTRPDVVLMDIRMPAMDGIQATRKLLDGAGSDAPHVLILTTFDLDEYVYEAMKAGASGFLLKDVDPADLAHRSASWLRATRCSPRPSPAG